MNLSKSSNWQQEGEAHASAIGSAPVRTFEYSLGGVTVKVPTGCMFTHIIRSGGRKITYQNAGVDCAFVGALSSGFCNWRIDFIESSMVEQQDGQNSVRVQEARRRQVGFAAFVAGVAVTLAFFAFFPGLPHIIDWGAILLSLAVGGLAQWGCRSWMTTAARKRAKAAHDSSGRDTTTDWPPLLVGALIAAINAG